MKREGVLIVPKSGHYAFEIENALKDKGVECLVIPTPKVVSSECGVSLLISKGFLKEGISVIEERCQDKVSGVYLMPETLPLSLKVAKV